MNRGTLRSPCGAVMEPSDVEEVPLVVGNAESFVNFPRPSPQRDLLKTTDDDSLVLEQQSPSSEFGMRYLRPGGGAR